MRSSSCSTTLQSIEFYKAPESIKASAIFPFILILITVGSRLLRHQQAE